MKIRSVKLPVSFLFILFFALSVAAQEQPAPECTLTNAPRLGGLTLGMSPAEVRAIFGKNPSVKVKSSGDRTFFQNYINKKAPASLNGVRAFYLRFLDGSLYQIEIFYEERADIPTLVDFVSKISAAMNLPQVTAWRLTPNRAAIDCGAFTIAADKTINPRVELTDKTKLAEAEARRKKEN